MRLSTLLAVLPLALAGPTGSKRSEPAPLHIRGSTENLIPDEYIVKFKKGSALAAVEDAMALLDADPRHVFKSVFQGFTGKLSGAILKSLRDHPDVEYIEQNSKVKALGYVSQDSAPWGLSRISHRQAGAPEYTYDETAGQGTCAYIIDSGLDASHPDFDGRAEEVTSFNNGAGDNCGHGTHVAGTIGSTTYGVAKKTSLYGIKVLELDQQSGLCTGDNSVIIQGMEHVAKDAANRDCPNGVVVNMSIGGDFAQALNDAAAGLVQQGYFVGIAAGNDNADAANYSPASEPSVCTVGGTARDDTRYTGSNYGELVDILGPGVDVLSTLPGGKTGQLTGTSMATPHIVGLAAYLAARDGKKAGPDLCQAIQDNATKDAITDQPAGTVNLLAFNGNPSGE